MNALLTLDNNFTNPAFHSFLKDSRRDLSRIHNHTIQAFQYYRDQIWIYVNPALQITRRGVQITAHYIPKFSPKMLKVFSAMGLSAMVSALFTLSRYPGNVKTLIHHVNLNDLEGIITSCISLIINPLDLMDSIITFSNALAKLGALPVISVFSLISLPVVLVLLGYSSIRGIYDSVQLGMILHQLPDSIDQESLPKLRRQLELLIEGKKGSNPTSHLSARTRQLNILTRRTDKKIVAQMKKLLCDLQSKKSNTGEINQDLMEIRSLIKRKLTVLTINTLAAICLGSLLSATYLCSIPTVVIASAILTKHALSLCKNIYNNFY